MERKVGPWIRFLVGFGIVGTVLTGLVAIPGMRSSSRASNDRSAFASLRTVHSAQSDFRINDRDRNGRQDYWRQDIAGLYTVVPSKDPRGDPLRLIEVSLAGADAAPVSSAAPAGPRAGYLYRTLGFSDEDPARPDPDRYAAQTYPANPASGRTMFIVSHAGVIWRKAAVPGGIDVFPDDPAADGWSVIR